VAEQKKSAFEFIIEVFGWLRIVASPLLAGVAIGFIVVCNWTSDIGLIVGISIAALGLIVGIIWATRVWKRKGTIEFLSRVSATPELDRSENDNGDVNKK
jgi:hypothetical protein